jgi:signal peptidase II
MRNAKWLFLVGVALAVILLDQVTKALVVANLALYEQWAPVEALRPYFTLTYIQNTGAAFGLLPNGGWFFVAVAVLVSGLIVYFYRTMPDQTWLIRAALGLQLGGGLGNLVDRIQRGYVVDFLDFKFWPVFNVADSALVVGVIALLVATWWQERQARAPQDNSSSQPSR